MQFVFDESDLKKMPLEIQLYLKKMMLQKIGVDDFDSSKEKQKLNANCIRDFFQIEPESLIDTLFEDSPDFCKNGARSNFAIKVLRSNFLPWLEFLKHMFSETGGYPDIEGSEWYSHQLKIDIHSQKDFPIFYWGSEDSAGMLTYEKPKLWGKGITFLSLFGFGGVIPGISRPRRITDLAKLLEQTGVSGGNRVGARSLGPLLKTLQNMIISSLPIKKTHAYDSYFNVKNINFNDEEAKRLMSENKHVSKIYKNSLRFFDFDKKSLEFYFAEGIIEECVSASKKITEACLIMDNLEVKRKIKDEDFLWSYNSKTKEIKKTSLF